MRRRLESEVEAASAKLSPGERITCSELNLPTHVIAAQMGWSESAVQKMIATYGQTEIGARDAIDAAFATVPDANPTPLGLGAAQLGAVDDVPPPL